MAKHRDEDAKGFRVGNKDTNKRGGSTHDIERDEPPKKAKPLPPNVEGHQVGGKPGRKGGGK
jgi:hypothetical protein